MLLNQKQLNRIYHELDFEDHEEIAAATLKENSEEYILSIDYIDKNDDAIYTYDWIGQKGDRLDEEKLAYILYGVVNYEEAKE